MVQVVKLFFLSYYFEEGKNNMKKLIPSFLAFLKVES
jgi:hypothetical protein